MLTPPRRQYCRVPTRFSPLAILLRAHVAAVGDKVDCGLGVDTATINKGDTTIGCETVIIR